MARTQPARRGRFAALVGALLFVGLGCAGVSQQGPRRYAPVEELRRCGKRECVEGSLEFRHWADAAHYRGRLPYHASVGAALDGPPNPDIERVIVVIHGVVGETPKALASRTVPPALEQILNVRSALAKAVAEDASLDPERIAILAPTFQITGDWQPYTDADPRAWTWRGVGWNRGADAVEGTKRGRVVAEPVSSFAVLDELLRASLLQFPNLREVVLVGHSSGGQTVHRYNLLGVGVIEHLAHEGVHVRSVVANPGMYAFPSRRRKLPADRRPRAGEGEGETGSWRWALPQGCKDHDRWGFGLTDLPRAEPGEALTRADEAIAYALDTYLRPADRKLARRGRNDPDGKEGREAARQALLRQYASREIWHLQATTDTVSTFGSVCPATAQGRSRLERFRHFEEAWRGLVGLPTDSLHFVPVEGTFNPHNSRAIYVSEAGRHLLFH
ncbi:hypothetical protein [Plesiocystis pacifica]|uniref:hypothetical protein n=1 Tax=Plesiocystis pacifica TaxID=191768 RepID=UPI0012FBD8C8|nr:hypothetical protein [Plesiocystis pacifica]